MTNPKPISLTQVAEGAYDGREKPQEFVVVGPIPGGGGGGGGGAVSSVNSKTGDVVLAAADVGAAPTSHTHSIADVADLQQTLDSKATAAQGAKADTAVQPTAIANFVPATRKVAGKELAVDVTLTKGDVGLDSVDNTSDANKPVSTAAAAALELKADKTQIVVLGILDHDETPPSAGVWLRRPTP